LCFNENNRSGSNETNYAGKVGLFLGEFSNEYSPAMTTQMGAAFFVDSGNPYIFGFGGETDGFAYLNTAYLYDIIRDLWALVWGDRSFSNRRSSGSNSYESGNVPPARRDSPVYTSTVNGIQEFYIGPSWGGSRLVIPGWQNSVWKARFVSVCNGVDEDNVSVCEGNGGCSLSEECVCDDVAKYRGMNCEYPVCYGIPSNESSRVCAGHGMCLDVNTCDCDENFGDLSRDPGCTQAKCLDELENDPNVCFGHGKCSSATFSCKCEYAYSGSACDALDAVILTLRNEWYVWFLILPVVVFVGCLVVVFVGSCVMRMILKQTRKLKRYGGLEDIEMLFGSGK